MAATSAKDLRLVIVTPETTLLDEHVSALRFPLYDGQIGILPGRAPLVGRLGTGELHLAGTSGGEKSFFVDGGFVQVKDGVVSILTDRAMSTESIDPKKAADQLQEATQRKATTDQELTDKLKDQERARRMMSLAKR